MTDFLAPRSANCPILTPIDFLFRSADVFPNRIAIRNGSQVFTWKEYANRCKKLASALVSIGIKRGDIIAVLAPNSPAMIEAHFAIPIAGAVINALNIRLDPTAIAFILEHSEAKLIIVDQEFGQRAKDAIALLKNPIEVVDVIDPEAEGELVQVGDKDYESFLEIGNDNPIVLYPNDEWDPISISYTSGTTGNPKGVLNSHRCMYLTSISQILHHKMVDHPVYLWTLPLFHVNGWAFSWGVAAASGTHICLRRIDPCKIFEIIAQHNVSHMCCAPIVLGFLIDESKKNGQRVSNPVNVMTAGSAPPAVLLEDAKVIGFVLRHVYGLTEMSGVVTICEIQDEWKNIDNATYSKKLARQGVRTIITSAMDVIDPITLVSVPRNAEKIGEIVFRGHGMKGYLKNEAATEEAFANGWFHSGDLAVIHPDGYIEIKDRSKDIIISGGENISSIEIEDVLYEHPSIVLVGVVAMPHEKWGEVPCAFVQLKANDENITEEDILEYCRKNLAKFKVPKRIIFGPIETTATGKIQKFKLRALMKI